ncbi:DNA gyrase subunit A, partial [hydrothermal vent metagenome]
LALIENPELSIKELMDIIPGPDFPTAAIINGVRGIHEAYHTGRGRVHIRSRSHVEGEEGRKQSIVVTELPYQVNKARLLEKIAELVKDKKIEGISNLRDESDKDGMRMVIELKRGEVAEVILNNLYQQTQMQSVFGINMVALVDGQPRLLNLKQILEAFVRHRRDVVTRRTVFKLRKARERAHVLEGLAVALANIDEVIALIKSSSSRAEARAELARREWAPGVVSELLQRSGATASRPDGLEAEFGYHGDVYRLSEVQAQAILDLRLHQITGLEQDKIVDEYRELIERIDDLLDILNNPDRLMQVIRGELDEVLENYGDERRTEILTDHLDLTMEDLITEEDVVVTLSHQGYAKSQPLSDYRAQRRGGRGKAATRVKEEDFIDKLFVASTHDTILCFSSRGKAYWLKVYQLPQAGRMARGKPIVNLLPLEDGERINAVLPIREFPDDLFVFMATAQGTVKKTPLSDFSRQRSNGIIAVDLRPDDYLINVAITDGTKDVMLFSNTGKVIRFHESDVRPMGRTACGVRGIRLSAGQRVIASIIVSEGAVLTATEHGYGKRTPVSDYPVHGRGGQGVISIQSTERNGEVIGAVLVQEDDEFMLISNGGTLVRTRVAEVSVMSRNTQGVRLIKLHDNETLVGIEPVADAGADDDSDSDTDSETNSDTDSDEAPD